jgi:hypothetical protein
MTICEKVGKGMDELKGQLVKTRRLINDRTSWKDAKDSFLTMFDTVVDTVEINANAITDVAAMADKYETEIEKKDRTISILTERVKELERRKDSQEIKDSQDEMASEIRQAMTSFKVMDLDQEKETDDRKTIIDKSEEAINKTIRSDMKETWTSVTRTAKIIPVGRKTTKRQVEGKDIVTVPILIKIDDRDSRWQAEECLRKSKIHPTFHWPQGMIGHVKKFRQDIVDSGIDDKDYYIRIRPEDRNGKLRIRGDIKKRIAADLRLRLTGVCRRWTPI